MTDESKNVEVSIEQDFGEGTSASIQRDGKFSTQEANPRDTIIDPADKVTVDADALDAEVEDGLKDDAEGAADAEPKDKPEGEADGEGPKSVDIGLPDFDAANEEVKAQYTAKYLNEDGTGLNFGAFNESFYKNLDAGLVDIHPSEREFVKAELKISDAAIDTYLSGLAKGAAELGAKQDLAVATAYGSGTADADGLKSALAWATSEGYTQAQKDRYNAALDAAGKGDPSLLEEQAELLRVRYEASGKKAAPVAEVQKPKRREVSPAASASGAANADGPSGGIKPFETMLEFQKAQAAAYATDNREEMLAVQKRMKASPKLWKGGHFQ